MLYGGRKEVRTETMAGDCMADFRAHGFAVVRGVFGAREVAEIAQAFERIYAEGLAHRASYRHGNVHFRIAEDNKLGRVVRLVQWPAYFDAVLDRVRRDARMLAIVRPLIGDNLKQIINQLHWKVPGADRAEFGFHQDIRFRRPRSAYRHADTSYVQTGIAIDPHRRRNGAMRLFPGSHKLGELGFEKAGRIIDRALDEKDLVQLGLDPGRLIDLELEPGDVALWHLYVVHGSGPNRGDDARRFYLNGYVRAENCDRGEWTFRDGKSCPLGEPVLVHYEDLHRRPEPHYVD